MKRRNQEEGGGDSWLNTYADMVTLLLTFFAVLLSMSTTDEMKFNAFIQSFSSLPHDVIEEIINSSNSKEEGDGEVVISTDMDELYQSLKNYVEENDQGAAVEITKVGEVIYIRFSSFLFFEPDEYVLRQSSIPVLSFIGQGLIDHEEKIRMVNVLGFTATIENGTYWLLSGERSAVVASFFNYDCGFPDNKLTVIGYGNQYPIAPNDSEENRKKNRRVELVIVGTENEEDFDLDDALKDLYNTNYYPTEGSIVEAQLPENSSETPPGRVNSSGEASTEVAENES